MVNVTSGLGSFAVRSDESRIEHIAADAGLLGQQGGGQHAHLGHTPSSSRNLRVNTVDPGYTATDFNGHSGPQTVTEGTDAIVAMAPIGPDGPTGTFTDRHGAVGW